MPGRKGKKVHVVLPDGTGFDAHARRKGTQQRIDRAHLPIELAQRARAVLQGKVLRDQHGRFMR
jgi:hypothetical protein